MHKMMLVVSLKTAEGTLCMVLHSIAYYQYGIAQHSIVWHCMVVSLKTAEGTPVATLAKQRGPNVLLTKPRNKKSEEEKQWKGLQWPLYHNKEAPMHVLGFLLTKHTEKLENNKCYCQVTNLRCQQRAVSRLWSQFHFIASTAAEILRMFCKMEITSEITLTNPHIYKIIVA